MNKDTDTETSLKEIVLELKKSNNYSYDFSELNATLDKMRIELRELNSTLFELFKIERARQR